MRSSVQQQKHTKRVNKEEIEDQGGRARKRQQRAREVSLLTEGRYPLLESSSLLEVATTFRGTKIPPNTHRGRKRNRA
ncbi:hypothetical protein E2542_SST26656 [Spatholobus suberectus]|nr:hypothetical protein E2542_SST26656 [Spatholobus suberectus]